MIKHLHFSLVFLVLTFSLSFTNGYSQVSKEFWFVAPDISSSVGDEPIALRLTAFSEPAQVTISMPADPSFTPIVVNIPANTQLSLRSDDPLYSALFNTANIENAPFNTINNNGLFIQSTVNISAYYEILASGNPETFILKGDNGLGTRFVVPSQNQLPNDLAVGEPKPYEQIHIVATEDNTTVTITPPAGSDVIYISPTGVPITVGQPITVTLNKGETFGLRANGQLATTTLAGIDISANKNIAVTVADDSIKDVKGQGDVIPRDLVGDQLVPVSVLGTEYIAIRTATSSNESEMVYVVTTEPNTEVEIISSAGKTLYKGLLGSNEQISYPITGATGDVYIKSNNPVYVYQVTGLKQQNQLDYGSAVLPPIACTGSSSVSFVRSFANSFNVQLIVQDADRNNFKMYDNAGNEVSFLGSVVWRQVTTATGTWYVASIDMSSILSTNKVYTIVNTTGLFHLSVVNMTLGGHSKQDTGLNFGYFSSYSNLKIDGPTLACVGNSLELAVVDPKPGATYYWTSQSTGSTILSYGTTFTADRTDRFYLTTTSSGCVATDYIDVEVVEPEIIFPQPTYDLCPGESAVIVANDNPDYTYEWNVGGSTTNTITIPGDPGTSQNVSLTVTDINGCTSTQTVVVNSYEAPVVDITIGDVPYDPSLSSINVCMGDTIFNRTPLVGYRWYFNGQPLVQWDGKDHMVPSGAGNYSLVASSQYGCATTQDIEITVSPLPTISIAPDTGCPNVALLFSGPVGMKSYLWGDGSTGNTYTATKEEWIWLQVVDQNNCSATDSTDFKWYPDSPFEISYNVGGTSESPDLIYLCPNDPYSLTSTPGYSNYTWSTGDAGTNNISVQLTPNQQTVFWSQAVDANGCTIRDTVTVTAFEGAYADLSKVPSAICLGDTIFNESPMVRHQWAIAGQPVNPADNLGYFVPNQTGTYDISLTVWSAENCSTTVVKQLTVNPLPTVVLTDVWVCPNTTATVSGPAGMASYLWSDNSVAQQFTSNVEGNFWLEVTDANGCKSSDDVSVAWHAQPTVEISYFSALANGYIQPSEIYTCPENQVDLVATSGFSSYLWNINPAVTGNSITTTVPVGGETLVTVEIADANTCVATDQIRIIANPTPVPDLSMLPDAVCLGESLTVPDNFARYQWAVAGQPLDPSQNGTVFTPPSAGVYDLSLTVWNAVYGCSGTATKTVTVNALPAVSLSDATVCPNVPVVYDGPAGMSSYEWNGAAGAQQYTATTAGGVTLRVVDANGCANQSSAQVSWHAAPVVDITYYSSQANADLAADDIYTCPENAVTLTATPGFSSYVWSHDAVNGTNVAQATVPVGGQTVVNLSVVDANGCPAADMVTLHANPTPVPDLSMLPDAVCLGESLTVPDNFARYQWAVAGQPLDPSQNGTVFTPPSAGVYDLSLTVWNAVYGCSGTATKTVTVNALPAVSLSDATVCPNVPVVYDGPAGMSSYEWNGAAGAQQYTATTAGGVTLRVVDANGCANQSSALVSWHAAPVVDITYYSSQANADLAADDIYTCPENAVTLTATPGFSSYVWSHDAVNGTNVAQATVPVGGQTVVNLSVVDANGCPAADMVTLHANPTPVPDLSVLPDAVCLGESLTVPDNFARYQWAVAGQPLDPSQNGTVFTPPSAGVYDLSLTVWNAVYGCSGTATKAVTVNALPAVSLSDATVCPNVPVVYDGPAGMSSYEWNGAAGAQQYTATTAGGVTLRVVDANGCANQSSALVSWHAAPVVDITYYSSQANADLAADDIYTCPENAVTLTATPGFSSYVWSHDAVNGTNVAQATVPVGGQTVVNLSVVDANGCPAADMVTLHANPTPVPDLSMLPDAVCLGESLTVPDNFARYQWAVAGQPLDPSQNGTVFTPPSAGVYDLSLTVWNAVYGCSGTATKTVTVNALPAVSLSDATVCPNVPVVYDGPAGMSSYEWNGAAGAQQYTATTAGGVTLRVVDANGCANQSSALVSWHAAPVVDITYYSSQANADLAADDIYTCPENAVTLTATPGFSSYVWSHDAVNGTNVAQATVPVGGQTVVNLSVVDANGCPAADMVTLHANPTPVPDLSVLPDAVCLGESLTVPDNFARYQWAVAGQPLDPSQNGTVFTPPSAGVYDLSLTVWNAVYGCSGTATKTVTVNALPAVSLSDATVCPNVPVVYDGPAGMSSYEWNGAAGAQQYTATTAGGVTLRVVDANGCANQSSALVSWHAAPVVDITYYSSQANADLAADDIYTCPENAVTLTATPGFSSYVWSHDAVNGTNVAQATVPVGGQTVVNLSVVDANGCPAADMVTLHANPTPVPDLSVLPDAVCLGESLTVPDNFARYQWAVAGQPLDPSQNGTVFTPPSAGVYDLSLTVWNAVYGCSGTATKTVTVNALPAVSLSDATVCPNVPVVYDGPAGMSSYEWNGAAGAQQYTATTAGGVTLRVTDANGCVNTTVGTVTWHPSPIVGIYDESWRLSDTVYTCPVPSGGVLLTATNSFVSYAWTVDGMSNPETSNVIQIAPPVNGQALVQVTATDANGCAATDWVRVIALPSLPSTSLDALKSEICVFETISIAPVKDIIMRHQWQLFDNGMPVDQVAKETDTYTPQQGGQLQLTVWNEYGCALIKTIVVHEPIIEFVNGYDKAAQCYGTSYEFGVVPVVDYTYTWTGPLVGETFEATAPGTYWVEMTHNTLGCKTKAPVELEWYPGALFEVQNQLVVCQSGMDYVLNGDTRMENYVWYKRTLYSDGTDTGYEEIVSARGDKSYTTDEAAVGTDAVYYRVEADYIPDVSIYGPNVDASGAACPLVQDFEFVVNPEPAPIKIDETFSCGAGFVPYDVLYDKDGDGTDEVYSVPSQLCICEGASIQLEGYNDFETYQWYYAPDATSGFVMLPGPGATMRVLTITTPGIYLLRAQQPFDPSTGASEPCVSVGLVEVVVNPNPEVNIGLDRSICVNETFQLENTGAGAAIHNHVWSWNGSAIAGDNDQLLENQTKTGNYSVIVTNSFGCSSQASISVTTPAAPEISLKNTAICEGLSYSLADKFAAEVNIGTFNYVGHRWYLQTDMSNELTGAGLNQSPAAGNHFYVLQVDVAKSDPANPAQPNCTFEFKFRLLVNPKPNFEVVPDYQEICRGDVATLQLKSLEPDPSNFTPYNKYDWTMASDGNVSVLGNTYQLSVSESDVYRLTVRNTLGCTWTDEGQVVVNELPLLVLTRDKDAFCYGEDQNVITLQDAGLYNNIVWSSGASDDGQPAITVTEPGFYTVTASDAKTCRNNQSITIDVFPKVEVVLPETSSTICANETYTLEIPADQLAKLSASDSFQWYLNGAVFGALNQSSLVINQPGTYRLEAKDPNGCSVIATFELTVNTIPVFNIVGPAETCEGFPVTLGSDMPYRLYQWSNLNDLSQAIGASQNIQTSVGGTYRLRVWDSNGCSDSRQTVLTVHPSPVVSLGPDVTVCKDAPFTLSPQAGDVYSAYLWGDQSTATYDFTSAQPGTYTLRVWDTFNCYADASVTVSNHAETQVVLASRSAAICAGDIYTLSLPASEIAKLKSYQWRDPLGNLIGLPDQPVDVSVSGTYTLDAIDLNDCSAVVPSFVLTVHPLPVFGLNGPSETCEGVSVSLGSDTPFRVYQWTNLNDPAQAINSSQSVQVAAEGTYMLRVWDSNGCSDSRQTVLTVHPSPVVSLGPDVTVCKDAPFTLSPQSGDVYSAYLWGDQSTATYDFTSAQPGTYTLRVWDTFNCYADASVTVSNHAETQVVLASRSAAICAGDIYTLSLPASETAKLKSYQWRDPLGNLIGLPDQPVDVSVAGTYTLDAIDLNDCSAVVPSFVLTVHPLPVFGLNGPSETCEGVSVSLGSDTPFRVYQWTNLNDPAQAINSSQSVQVAAEGTYMLRVWDSNGCSDSRQTVLTVHPSPVVSLGPDVTVCKDAPFTLSPQSGDVYSAYLWGDQSTATYDFTSAQPGTYTLRVWDTFNCYADASVTVSNHAETQVVLAARSAAICAGDSYTLSLAASETAKLKSYQWRDPLGNLIGLPDQPVDVSVSGTYTLDAIDLNDCSAVVPSFVLTVHPLPVFGLNGPSETCEGVSVSLGSDTPFRVYQWTNLNDPAQAINSSQSVQVAAEGTYMLRVWDSNGCSDSRQTVLTVHPSPVVSLGPDVTVCKDAPFTLSPQSGDVYSAYLWGDQSTATYDFTSAQPGTYTLRVWDTFNCYADASVTVSNHAETQVVLASRSAAICAGDIYTLSLPASETAKLKSYQWRDPLGNLIGLPDQPVDVSVAGTYTLDAIDLNDCSAVVPSFVLTVHPLPVFGLNGPSETCEGVSVSLGSDTPFRVYQWTNLNDPAQAINSSQSVQVAAEGTYMLRVWDSNGCSDSRQTVLTVHPSPVVSLGPDVTVCKDAPFTLSPQAGDVYSAYLWGDQSTATYDFTSAQPGTYTLRVWDTFNCYADASVTVSNHAETQVVLAAHSAAICAGDSYTLSLLPSEESKLTTYQWRFGGNLIGAPNQPVTVSEAGNYELVGYDANGCLASVPQFVLSVRALPVFDLGPDKETCQDVPVLLDAGADFAYYKWDNLDDPSQEVRDTKAVGVSIAGNYQLQVWDDLGCSSTDQIGVVVYSKPVVAIDPATSFICSGESSVVLSLAPHAPYSSIIWSNGATNVEQITVSVTGQYGVLVVDAAGCRNDAVATVEAYPKFNIYLPYPDTTICANEVYTLRCPYTVPDQIASYQWYYQTVNASSLTGGLNQPWQVSQPGLYVLLVTDLNGCTSSSAFTLKTKEVPVVELGPDKFICDATTTQLLSDQVFPRYRWTLVPDNATTLGSNQSLTVSQQGTYQIEVWNSVGCSSTDQVSVFENQNPTVRITGTNNALRVCKDSDFTLEMVDFQSAYFPTWTRLEWSNGVVDNTSITVNKTGTYSLKALDGNGCVATASVTVTNFPTTTVTVGAIDPICDNAPTVLGMPVVSPNVAPQSYQWFYESVGNAQQGPLNGNWSVNTAGTYVVQVFDANGCSATSQTSLQVNPAPVFELGANRTKCLGDTIRVVANGNFMNYSWNGIDGNESFYVTNTTGVQTVTLEVTHVSGCKATDNVELTVNPLPVVTIDPDYLLVCPGTNSVLTAQTSSQNSILWSTNETTASINVRYGDFWVQATDGNGCVNRASSMVEWRQAPQPNLGLNDIICPTETLTLDAGYEYIDPVSGQEVEYAAYQWITMPGDDFNTTSRYRVANISDTVNLVMVTDRYGCTGWTTKVVRNFEPFPYHLSDDVVMCASDELVLDADPTNTYTTFLWEDGSTEKIRTVVDEGEYSVWASDGCVWVMDTMRISHLPMPEIVRLDTMIYAQITVEATGGAQPYQYALNGGNLQRANTFKYLTKGLYEVYVEDSNGCFVLDSVELGSTYDLDIPNFFTPNGDGFNDEWEVEGLQRFPDAEILIFDRYGKLLAKLKGSSPKWDGRYLGKVLPSDDYWYVINLVNVKRTIKGNITLKR